MIITKYFILRYFYKDNKSFNTSINKNNKINSKELLRNVSNEINLPDEQILISKLLNYYDPAARPVYNAGHQVIVNFSFALIQLCDLVLFIYSCAKSG